MNVNQLWGFDLPHIGTLCGRVRSGRGLTQTQIAAASGLHRGTISDFEKKPTTRDTFERYVQALQSETRTHPDPLQPHQVAFLFKLYDYFETLKEHERQFSAVDYKRILPHHRPNNLGNLVALLEELRRPALIMDPLWFVHAINGALLQLFGVRPDSKLLDNWAAWHAIAIKLHSIPTARQAHYDPDEFFAPTLEQLFMDSFASPYMFTFQMRMLINKLHELSAKNGLSFSEWWNRATSLRLSHARKSLKRTIWYQEQPIQTGISRQKDVEIEINQDYRTVYTLSVWEPIGNDAEIAFKKIYNAPRSWKIFYAADYDKDYNFHVNTWSEVEAYNRTLFR